MDTTDKAKIETAIQNARTALAAATRCMEMAPDDPGTWGDAVLADIADDLNGAAKWSNIAAGVLSSNINGAAQDLPATVPGFEAEFCRKVRSFTLDARDWQLYSSDPASPGAAIGLNNALRTAFEKNPTDPAAAQSFVRGAAERYWGQGAGDTEPDCVLADALTILYGVDVPR